MFKGSLEFGNFLMTQQPAEVGDALLHLKPLRNYHAHVKVPLSAIGQAGSFTGAELASWGAGYAFVPAHICQLGYHLTHHHLVLLLLQELLQLGGGVHGCSRRPARSRTLKPL